MRGAALTAGLLGLLACLLLPHRAGHADAIVLSRAAKATTIAEIYVEADRVRVELEIGVPDLQAFQNLLPDPVLEKLGLDAVPLKERLPIFFAEDWIVEADGERLPGRPTHLEGRPRLVRDVVTGEPLPATGEDPEFVLYVGLEFPFAGHPQTLSVQPPGGRERSPTRASIGFVTYHLGLPVTDFRYLATEEILDLDWADPFFSRYRNRNLRRQYDAPVSAFLYVDAYEVRKEVVLRPKDLEPWLDLGLGGLDVIPVDRQGEVKQQVAAFLKGRGPVVIDGVSVPPLLDRVHFLRRTLRTTGVIDPPEDLPTLSATLGVIFAYPVEKLPERVEMTWDLFNERVQMVPASATDEACGLPSQLTPEEPVLVWQNYLQNPRSTAFAQVEEPPPPGGIPFAALLGILLFVVVGIRALLRQRRPAFFALGLALVLVGLGLLVPVWRVALPGSRGTALPEDEARPVIQALLENVYRAFDVRGEERVYDALRRSVDGDLLRRVYLETRAALELANQGGARAKVEDVEVEDVQTSRPENGSGFQARCRWRVTGSVGHWGHIHQRTNAYDAELTVRPVAGQWRVTDLKVLGEERR